MWKHTHGKRALALGMSLWMTAVCILPAGAAPIDSGVVPTYDEAYYASLDYYGNLMEGSVVKSYALNGASSVTDYGVYDQVVNLTDATPVTMGEGRAAFQFSQAPDHFYFEGKTAQPFQELPWTITLRYTLNGVPARAEELAGQRGVVEIMMDIVPNETASDYARYNYTLEAMAMFNQDDILSLEAPGAQVQLVGNLRTVLFMALPGEEEHFTIRVGSDDFSFAGMTILMVPATLGQLEEIAKLSQRKDQLEEDYRALSGSLDTLLDALNDIQSGLYASANGLDQLDVARGTISDGKGLIYADTDVLREDLSNIADILSPVQQRAQTFSQAVTDANGVLGAMTDTALSLKGQLDELDKALQALEDGTGDVKRFMERAADLKGSLEKLQSALNKVKLSSTIYIDPPEDSTTSAGQLVDQVVAVHQVYETARAKNRTAFFAGMLKLQKPSLSDGDAAAQAQQMEAALDSYQPAIEENVEKTTRALAADTLKGQGIPEELISEEMIAEVIAQMTEEQKTAIRAEVTKVVDAEYAKNPNWTTIQSLNQLYQGAASGQMSFQSFCEAILKVQNPNMSEADRKKTAKQMNDLWTVYSGGAAKAGGLASVTVSQTRGGVLAGALAGSLFLADLPDGAPSEERSDAREPAPEAEDTPEEPAPEAEDTPRDPAPTERETPEEPAPTPAVPDANIGSAAVDLIAGSIDEATGKLNKTIGKAIDDMNEQLEDFQDELNKTLRNVARPTATVVGELADLCGQLDELTYLLDNAADLSAALRQISPTVKTLLDRTGELRDVLDGYVPTVQAALTNVGKMSAATVSLLRNMENLLSDTEELLKTSGSQLDEGTRQTLRGLSAALRQTGRALSTTQDVKDAKNTLTNIIEDTWNEYTGDVNNILLMDAGAEPVSLTDSRNPTPSSVQVLIRTQEIKADEGEETALTAEPLSVRTASAGEPDTFWGRVARMFRDFWSFLTGIFH